MILLLETQSSIVTLEEQGTHLPSDPTFPFLDRYPRKWKTFVHIGTRAWMFYTSFIMIANQWRQPRCLSLSRWLSRVWYSPIVEYNSAKNYSTIDKSKKTIHVKYFMLSERSQIQNATCCMISFFWHLGKGKTIWTENRSVITEGLGSGEGWITRGNFFR